MGEREYGLDPAMVARVAAEIDSVHRLGVELCLVIGGGNIFRGVSGAAVGMDAPRPTTWACWQRSLTRSQCKTS